MQVQNTIKLIGNLGAKPIQCKSTNGKTMATFSLATQETYSNNSTKVQEAQWHSVIAIGPLAERILNYTDKGDQIQVIGQMTYNNFTSVKPHKNANEVIFLKEVFFLNSNLPVPDKENSNELLISVTAKPRESVLA